MPLSYKVLVEDNAGLVVPPLWCHGFDGIVQFMLLLPLIEEIGIDLSDFHFAG
jgi:hypothetical protein